MAYHLQMNGQTECANQELEQFLRFYCDYPQENWVELLPLAQYVMNSRFHSAMLKGQLYTTDLNTMSRQSEESLISTGFRSQREKTLL